MQPVLLTKKLSLLQVGPSGTSCSPSGINVRRYDYTKTAASEGGFEARLSAYYAHPRYNAQKVTNDVALLRLATPVPAATATPVPLIEFSTCILGTFPVSEDVGVKVIEVVATDVWHSEAPSLVTTTQPVSMLLCASPPASRSLFTPR